MKRVTVQHGGKKYEAEIKPGDETSGAAESTAEEVWHVTSEGATVTTFPVTPGESDGSIREKVMEWLEANQDRPQSDVGRH